MTTGLFARKEAQVRSRSEEPCRLSCAGGRPSFLLVRAVGALESLWKEALPQGKRVDARCDCPADGVVARGEFLSGERGSRASQSASSAALGGRQLPSRMALGTALEMFCSRRQGPTAVPLGRSSSARCTWRGCRPPRGEQRTRVRGLQRTRGLEMHNCRKRAHRVPWEKDRGRRARVLGEEREGDRRQGSVNQHQQG